MARRSSPTATTVSPETRLRVARVIRNGSLAVFAAAAVCMIIAGVVRVFDVRLEMTEPGDTTPQAIPVLAFAAATLIAGAIGLVLAAFLAKRGVGGRRFAIVTGTLALLSVISPLAATASATTKLVLVITHLAAGAIIIPTVARELDR